MPHAEVEDELAAAKTYLAPLLRIVATGLECFDLPSEYQRDRFVGALLLTFSTPGCYFWHV